LPGRLRAQRAGADEEIEYKGRLHRMKRAHSGYLVRLPGA